MNKSKIENGLPTLQQQNVMRPLFIDKVEKMLLISKRFRKCDWQNIDGVNYLRMIDTKTLALAIRDIIKELDNGA